MVVGDDVSADVFLQLLVVLHFGAGIHLDSAPLVGERGLRGDGAALPDREQEVREIVRVREDLRIHVRRILQFRTAEGDRAETDRSHDARVQGERRALDRFHPVVVQRHGENSGWVSGTSRSGRLLANMCVWVIETPVRGGAISRAVVSTMTGTKK